jgi:hypothetical protein
MYELQKRGREIKSVVTNLRTSIKTSPLILRYFFNSIKTKFSE